MPNHVHVLTAFRQGFRLADVVRDWKCFSAHRINRILGRRGPVWQRDYFDRFIRDEAHFERVRFYIENNPVSAGLIEDAASWPYGSLAHA
jgi:REP element-mobilizing transposase RayT